MANQVAILHGWSDDSESFRPLAAFLERNGYDAVPIWLGDYISMSDEVRIEDVAKRMQEVVLQKRKEGELAQTFDLIVHSTGGLVARSWISTYYPNGIDCPVKRLLMLAPANFGSRLATAGKSLLGRVFKGWKHGFQTGREMLTALELASPFQWELAQRDLFVPEGSDDARTAYGEDAVWPFVIVGSHPYPSGPRTLVNENGSDGTVRVAAANLNVRGITVDFAKNLDDPELTHWRLRRAEDFAFPLAVLPDRDHGTVILPEANELEYEGPAEFGLPALILEALNCDKPDTYKALRDKWFAASEDTASLRRPENAVELGKRFPGRHTPDTEYYHQYVQIVVRVVDDHGGLVDDFFIEFFGRRDRKNRRSDEALYFHREVLENVHPKAQVATRCLFIDRTDLVENFYGKIPEDEPKELRATISAVQPGPKVRYFAEEGESPEGSLLVHSQAEDRRWLRRNSTHFVKIIIPRVPSDEVFTLTRYEA